jgi:hypothetical protein
MIIARGKIAMENCYKANFVITNAYKKNVLNDNNIYPLILSMMTIHKEEQKHSMLELIFN